MRKLSILLFLVAASGMLLMPFAAKYPKPKAKELKIYNLITLPSAEKVGAPGTHITNNGFCTTVWIDKVVDTVICGSHIATETTSGPAQGEDIPAPEKETPNVSS